MSNNQTAVEWAEDKLSDLNSAVVNGEIAPEEYHEIRVNIWKKAKVMEKEQIIDARLDGFAISGEGWNGEYPIMKHTEMLRETKCEEYYNETYGKK